jgi:hypothetical protein
MALLSGACSADTASGNSSGLSDLLPSAPGYGLPGNVLSEQVLDVGEASRALSSDQTATATELASVHYRSGFARVWGTATDYATMTVLAMGTTADAADFVAFEKKSLSAAQNTFVTEHSGIAGSFVFVISSPTQASGNQNSEICNGVWFAYRGYALESLACGSRPSWATQVEEAAKALRGHLVTRLG